MTKFGKVVPVARFGLLLALVACGSDGGPGGTIFPPDPECEGVDVVPHAGEHKMVISTLAIGALEDGFDLDSDGDPDNKLASIGSLAGGAIDDAFEQFSIILPLEFFDYPTNAVDACVKFGFYIGVYQFDGDADGKVTAKESDDCDDHDVNAAEGKPEIPMNRKDDDCDNLADEDVATNMPSVDTGDMDMDGQSLAQGDCDDNNAAVKAGGTEICGDGYDNDCVGGADWSKVNAVLACTPFDADTPDTLGLDALSFNTDGTPVIEFNSAETRMVDGKLMLFAGPSAFSVTVPVTDGIALDLRISGATIETEIGTVGGDLGFTGARLGGVLDANTLDKVRGLEVMEIGLKPEDSLLDAMFANDTLGIILNLDKIDTDGDMEGDCATPDIDVDRDGLEAFCDSNKDDEVFVVDTCIDGDGTIYHDGDLGKTHCSEILNDDGTFKFADGISVALTFDSVPASFIEQ